MKSLNFISVFFLTIKVFATNRKILWLSSIPVIIGVILYLLAGHLLYHHLYQWLFSFIGRYLSEHYLMQFFSAFFIIFFSVFVYFLVSWSFVLVVGLLAAPFNDFISAATVNAVCKKKDARPSVSILYFMRLLLKRFMIFFIFISLLFTSFALGLFFPPLALIASCVVMSVTFLDYSWARDKRSLDYCLGDLKTGSINYFIASVVLLFVMGIPLVNLVAIPFAVVVFTLIYLDHAGELK